jgi:hypothetical protein
MKKKVKEFTKKLFNKSLTDIEAIMLSLCQVTFSIMLCFGLIQFHVAQQTTTLIFGWILSDTIIKLTSLLINIMFTIQVIEHLSEIMMVFLCKCDYRQHPELHE